jgi:CheY-like chemotaxis protein
VLLVEDEDAVRRYTREALDQLGYTTVECESGERALAYFAQHHDALVLVVLDLVMPGMGGREVFAKMRAIDAEVPVLLCSGYTDRGDLRGELPKEAAGFLAKPFRMIELANAVRQAVTRRGPTPSK